LIEKGHVTQDQIEDAIKVQNAKLGSILVAQGAASKEAVKEAIDIQMQQGAKIDETIRVSLRKLDALLRLVGELSIQHSIVSNANKQGTLTNNKTHEAITLASKFIQDLQSEAMSLRMQPVDGLLRRLDRIARDVARTQTKQVRVIVAGENVEMDKTVLEKMKDPLVHIMRNAVDHGIETDSERNLAGKSPIATIHIEAVQTAANVCITIRDDGRGLNTERIRQKAISKGLISPNQNLSSDDIHNLIFLPGFSTADQVTDVSGRGVGMDVVISAVKALNGHVDIESEFGKGTTFSINLPSTLSVLDAIIVNVNNASYALPIADIKEVVDMSSVKIETTGSTSRMVSLRGKVVPVEDLSAFLACNNNGPKPSPTVAIVTSSGKSEIALLVDQIIGQQSIVVRPVEKALDEIPGFSGATILASGDPAMIIQLSQIIKSQQRKAS
jgi:two-component system chemotaxis sensor kinase CheA